MEIISTIARQGAKVARADLERLVGLLTLLAKYMPALRPWLSGFYLERHCCRFSRIQFEEADALSRKKDSIKGFFPPEQRIEWSEQPQVVSLHHRQQKTDARIAFPVSLSSTGQQSDETLHVQWFGGLVENASGMSRMLYALDASFSSAYSFFVLAFNEWLFKTSLVNGRGDLTESLNLRLDVPQVFWSLRPRTPGRRHVAGRAHAIFFYIRSSSETASWISKGRGAGQAHSGMQISGNADRLLAAYTTTAKEDRIVTSLSITPKDWPAAVRSRLNPCVHGSCGVLPR